MRCAHSPVAPLLVWLLLGAALAGETASTLTEQDSFSCRKALAMDCVNVECRMSRSRGQWQI